MRSIAKAQHHQVCPVWVGYLLASPIRTLFQNPQKILAPHVSAGMRVLDVGPAMGFFTLPLARLVGPSGRVICVEIQERMLSALLRRARRATLAGHIEARVCNAESLQVADLAHTIDFVLAFAVVHEVGNVTRFFGEVQSVLTPRGRVLFAEPRGHVSAQAFQESLSVAKRNGLHQTESVKISRSHAAILERT
ncbi:MAG: methyltransferase domain-containing protein [candidate division NC10 bacterium]|nr:methyltransferase domain-containing protein [candidate division NC10 bacterium]